MWNGLVTVSAAIEAGFSQRSLAATITFFSTVALRCVIGGFRKPRRLSKTWRTAARSATDYTRSSSAGSCVIVAAPFRA